MSAQRNYKEGRTESRNKWPIYSIDFSISAAPFDSRVLCFQKRRKKMAGNDDFSLVMCTRVEFHLENHNYCVIPLNI